MTNEERKTWVAKLQPGDNVGVFETRPPRYIFRDTVKRRTPTGRIITNHGTTYRSDGFLFTRRDDLYASRCIGPIE